MQKIKISWFVTSYIIKGNYLFARELNLSAAISRAPSYPRDSKQQHNPPQIPLRNGNEPRLSQNCLHLCRTGISRRGATNWVKKLYTTTPSKATPLFAHSGVTIVEPSVFVGSGIVSPRECIAIQSAVFKTTGRNQPISPPYQKLPPQTRQQKLKSDRRQY